MADRRFLRVTQADVVEPVGDQGFMISEYLFGGLLKQVGNRQHRYITSTTVSGPNALSLADSIEKIEETPQWSLAKAMNGDPTGDGVRAFCDWLRRGPFEMVQDYENLDGTT